MLPPKVWDASNTVQARRNKTTSSTAVVAVLSRLRSISSPFVTLRQNVSDIGRIRMRFRRNRIRAPHRRLSTSERTIKKRTDAVKCVDHEVVKNESWTRYTVPMRDLKFLYNLRGDTYEKIQDIYGNGRVSVNGIRSLRPKNPSRIRQGILSYIFMFEFNLSHSDICDAKNLATKRKLKMSDPKSSEEHMQWPARSDIFLYCPEMDPDAVSDDELADFFRFEKYSDQVVEASLSTEQPNTPIEQEDTMLVREALETRDDSSRLHELDHADVSVVDTHTVSLLKNLCETFETWGSADETATTYGISRTKAYEVRGALTDLMRGRVANIQWEDFMNTFTEATLMDLPLQKKKVDSIIQFA